MSFTLCDDCKATGLPLMPVLYATVPTGLGPKLPAWATGARVATVALAQGQQYALRTVHTGYVYVFYEKNAWGKQLWDCWTVTDDGTLLKQVTPQMASPIPALTCSRQAHDPGRLKHLIIGRPLDCTNAWIAYSKTKWSPEALDFYASNKPEREKRMQAFSPSQMARGTSNSHSTAAIEANLQGVIEYAPGIDPTRLPFDKPANTFSHADGNFDAAALLKVSSNRPWHLRTGQAAADAETMRKRATVPDGKPYMPQIMALWDAVGVSQEINGWCNDVTGWVALYTHERDLQMGALQAIDGLRNALSTKAQAQAKDSQRVVMAEGQFRNIMAVRPNPRSWPADVPYKRLTDQADIQRYGVGMVEVFPPGQAQRTAQAVSQAQSRTWARYAAHVDEAALKQFRNIWERLQADANTLLEARVSGLVAWLSSDLLISTLQDYRPNSLADGVLYKDTVGSLTWGMGAAAAGAKKLEEWAKQGKTSDPYNLLWRGLALNQTLAMADVDAALTLAREHATARTVATALNAEGVVAKLLKAFADTHKKAASIDSANTSASGASGSSAFGAKIQPINTRQVDKLAVTTGATVQKIFKVDAVGDFLSEKIIQHLFSVRALVDPADSLALIVAQAGHDTAARGHVLRRLQAAQTLLDASNARMQQAQSDSLKRAWDNFKATNAKAPQAMLDARLAVVVMLMEGLNFQKLMAECVTKNDAKTWWSLAASGMTIMSGLFDVASVPAKYLFADKAVGLAEGESWSYQRIKLVGGVLSAGAGLIGAGLDLVDAKKSLAKGNGSLAFLYGVKFVAGGASAALTLATTFTYAAPLIGRLTGQPSYAGAARAVGINATRVIGARILFMSAGAWLTVGTIGIQVFIWIFTDDKLQEWCEFSAFGVKRGHSAAYKNPNLQYDKFTEALVEVGV